MKLKKIYLLATAVFMIATCGCGKETEKTTPDTPDKPQGHVTTEYDVPVLNAAFDEDLVDDASKGWAEYRVGGNSSKATVKICEPDSRCDSRYLLIQQRPSDGKCCAGVHQVFSGLKPLGVYRATARIKYSDIPQGEGCGACLFPVSTDQYWGCSRFLYGTSLKDWTSTSVDFVADENGKADLVCALGFWQGGRGNGGHSTGAFLVDYVYVKEVSSELTIIDGEHIRLLLETGKVTISTDQLQNWVNHLDKVYEAYEDLVGDVPFRGNKISILTSKGLEGGYWALAGNPILWSSNYSAVEDTQTQVRDYDSWVFGLMHEIGHNFNIGYTNWDWNDEMFANFRMHYALDTVDGAQVFQDGELYVGGGVSDHQPNGIIEMYKKYYNQTVASTVNDNGIHYMLARTASQIGWEPFKKTFRYLNTHSVSFSSKYNKFEVFIDKLSEFSGQDVKAQFTTAELESIQRQLK